MADSQSTARRRTRKDFPLFLHSTGQWAKKVRNRLVYFGTDRDEALDRWLDEKDALLAGRIPRAVSKDELTVRAGVNSFLTAKDDLRKQGEISGRYFADLFTAGELVAMTFGKERAVSDIEPSDFAELRARIVKKYGVVRRKTTIINVRTMFKWLYDNGYLDTPVKYGSQFSVPKKRDVRKAKSESGKRDFTADQIRALIDAASQPLRTMILLAINTGIGNKDLAFMERGHIVDGFLDYTRRKTYVPRKAALWPETMQSLDTAIAGRPRARKKKYAELVFVTKYGQPWGNEDKPDSPITKEFRKLLDSMGIYRRGLSFYSLRHTFRTVADETKDFPAIDFAMGHVRDGVSDEYRQRISDERLEAVASHVRAWLYRKSRKPK